MNTILPHIFFYIEHVIVLLYILLILVFLVGWKRIPEFKNNILATAPMLSVIVPFRNEEKNLENIVQSIVNQNIDKRQIEVVFINDHSTDSSASILQPYEENYEFIKLLNLPDKKYGKKQAIHFGISNSKNEVIITTDADCIFPKEWLSSIQSYCASYQPNMLVAPVTFHLFSFWDSIMALEFSSLVFSGAAMCGINRPIMCNGANLVFKRSIYNEFSKLAESEYVSGDDVFLLLQIKKKYPNTIHFLKNKEAIAYTLSPQKISVFLQQRIRWASKSRGYKDFDILLVAYVVFFFNLIVLCFPILLLLNTHTIFVGLGIFIAFALEYFFLKKVNRFLGQKKLALAFFLVKLFYPIYILLSAFLGLLGVFSWKQRRYNKGIVK